MLTQTLSTDSLGFSLSVELVLDPVLEVYGKQVSYEDEVGAVIPTAIHRIFLREGLPYDKMVDAAAHEAYHLFYALRPHITADEETQAEVFGGLVRSIVELCSTTKSLNPAMNNLTVNTTELAILKRRYDHLLEEGTLYSIRAAGRYSRISEAVATIARSPYTAVTKVRYIEEALSITLCVVMADLERIMRLHSQLQIHLKGDWSIQFGQHRFKAFAHQDAGYDGIFRSVELMGTIEDMDAFVKVFNEQVYQIYNGAS